VRCRSEQEEHVEACSRCQLPFKLPRKRRSAAGVVAVAVAAGVVLVGVGGILGVRRYVDNARSAEARAGLGRIAVLAAQAYERDHRICPPANARVPADPHAIRGQFYQSTEREWLDDPGFGCLGFEMTSPQYYQYEYTATASGYVARARGDLNGNGMLSFFELRGEVRDGKLLPGELETRDIGE